MEWGIVQHVGWEGPGLIAAGLEARGWPVRVWRMDRGEALPPAQALAGLVVMGGPMGVYEVERHPYLRGEMELLAAMVAADKPVLGVCLGAQLLAAALGARVYKGPVMEMGAGWVELTEAGRADGVLGGGGDATLAVVHWHQDTFPLPAGATRLAGSELYPQQAFRVGTRAYGLQFHCEVDAALAAGWREHGLELGAAEVERVERAGRGVVERFLSLM